MQEDRKTFFGASMDKLAGLIGLGMSEQADASDADNDRMAGELLRRQLDRSDIAIEGLPPSPSEPLGRVLLGENTTLEAFESIKHWAKTQAGPRDASPHRTDAPPSPPPRSAAW